jgi:citrate synthase
VDLRHRGSFGRIGNSTKLTPESISINIDSPINVMVAVTPSERQWLDADEAARLLGVKPATLYSYVSRGLLHRRRDDEGRRSRFDRAELLALRQRARPRSGEHDLVFPSAVTTLGPDRPFFRGIDACRLAGEVGYEVAAELLWTGTLQPAATGWEPLATGLPTAVAAQTALPTDALPLDRLQVIVTTLAVCDPLRFNLDPDAVAATGRALIAGMVAGLPVQAGRSRDRSGRVAERLWARLTPTRPTPELVRVLDAALVVLADHELAASTVAARVAASVKADPYAVVSAALGVVSGPMHGGASGSAGDRRPAASR